MRPVLEYSGSVWDPSGVGLHNELEKVLNRAARFVTGNYNFETGSMTGILEHLRDSRLILLYKGLKGKASIPTDDLIPLVRRCRNDHSMAYQVPIANTDIYKSSFFPKTIRGWNALPDSLISSAKGAEDGVVKFTSLVNYCRSDVPQVTILILIPKTARDWNRLPSRVVSATSMEEFRSLLQALKLH